MKKFWKIWLKIAKKIMYFWANILLTVIYIVLMIPLSIVLQTFFKDALLGHVDSANKKSYWIKRKKAVQDLSFATEQ